MSVHVLTHWHNVLAIPSVGRGEGAGRPRQDGWAGVTRVFTHLQGDRTSVFLFFLEETSIHITNMYFIHTDFMSHLHLRIWLLWKDSIFNCHVYHSNIVTYIGSCKQTCGLVPTCIYGVVNVYNHQRMFLSVS